MIDLTVQRQFGMIIWNLLINDYQLLILKSQSEYIMLQSQKCQVNLLQILPLLNLGPLLFLPLNLQSTIEAIRVSRLILYVID